MFCFALISRQHESRGRWWANINAAQSNVLFCPHLPPTWITWWMVGHHPYSINQCSVLPSSPANMNNVVDGGPASWSINQCSVLPSSPANMNHVVDGGPTLMQHKAMSCFALISRQHESRGRWWTNIHTASTNVLFCPHLPPTWITW